MECHSTQLIKFLCSLTLLLLYRSLNFTTLKMSLLQSLNQNILYISTYTYKLCMCHKIKKFFLINTELDIIIF